MDRFSRELSRCFLCQMELVKVLKFNAQPVYRSASKSGAVRRSIFRFVIHFPVLIRLSIQTAFCFVGRQLFNTEF